MARQLHLSLVELQIVLLQPKLMYLNYIKINTMQCLSQLGMCREILQLAE